MRKDICLCCPLERTDKADKTEDDNMFLCLKITGLHWLKDTAYRSVCALRETNWVGETRADVRRHQLASDLTAAGNQNPPKQDGASLLMALSLEIYPASPDIRTSWLFHPRTGALENWLLWGRIIPFSPYFTFSNAFCLLIVARQFKCIYVASIATKAKKTKQKLPFNRTKPSAGPG